MLNFSIMDVGVIGFSLVIMLILYLFFKLTKMGTAMRATAQSQVGRQPHGCQREADFLA